MAIDDVGLDAVEQHPRAVYEVKQVVAGEECEIVAVKRAGIFLRRALSPVPVAALNVVDGARKR